MSRLAVVRRFAAILLLALWWGGFTFYALVVVPTGHQVLRSKIRQGFITQQVTNKLNWLGVATLALLAWQIVAARREGQLSGSFRTGAISWGVLAVTLAVLFWLHPHLDLLLDPLNRSVVDDDKFYSLHRWYLIVATVQWAAGAVHFGWLIADRHLS